MDSILFHSRHALAQQISQLSGLEYEKIIQAVERPKNTEHGDLAFPAFLLGKIWACPPPQAASRLCSEIQLPSSVESAQAIGPFANFRLKRGATSAAVVSRILKGDFAVWPQKDVGSIVIDYSSPNIAKPFHVGHLRATLVGHALDLMYRKLGYKVVSVNHLGDWGTQFGFVFAGCTLWGKPEHPSVSALVGLYKKATQLKEDEEKNPSLIPGDRISVNEMARKYFSDLEANVPYAREFWEWCLEISLEYFKKTYARLGISFDHYMGESFYSDKLDAVQKELTTSGILTESQGALGIDLGEKVGFARVLTPDGRSLYLTRDIATAFYRAAHFHFSKALYVVGAPQALHFQQLRGVLEALGKPYAKDIVHIPFGHVLGMKTRGGGEVVELNALLDEAVERALLAYREQVEKRPEGLDEKDVAEAVGLGAIIFSALNRSRIKDVQFSWEHALTFQGDSGPYALYAYARINGVREKATEAGLVPEVSPPAELLEEESGFQLALILDQFEATLERAVEENEPSILAGYALEVAKLFSRAYLDLKVVGAEPALAQARLSVFEATAKVLEETLHLLGMKVLERM